MKLRNWLLLALFLLIAAVMGIGYKPTPAADSAPPSKQVTVRTHTVSKGVAAPTLKLVGQLAANRSVSIAPEVTGRIVSIAVSSGQKVAKGETLALLDDGKQQAELAEQIANLEDESRKLADMRRLAPKGAVTQSELDRQGALRSQAKARVAAARYNLSLRKLVAPFSGTVSLIDLSEGALVNGGEILLHLDELDTLRLDLAMPERYLALLQTDMAVVATSIAWPDEHFAGRLTTLDSRVIKGTQNIKGRVIFDNEQGKLRPGMLLNVELSLPTQQMMLIPQQAVEFAGTERFIYRLEADNRVKRLPVILGDTYGEAVWVIEGLEVGDRIVTEGLVNVRDGSVVKDLATEVTTDVAL